MINAFGVDHTPISKGLPSYLRALGNSKTETELHSASPAIKRALKFADKKSLGDGRKDIMRAGKKHPEGTYMLGRILQNKVGADASKDVARGSSYAPKTIKRGQKAKSWTNEVRDKNLTRA